ncbi:hypothetical protein [Fundidesulfovibrio agrisoli]|uniref:hypothetical protein n=1 Tax=Fundidesulfovibrio agrisoli TaxID=2922717 RepID=UPI001FAD8D4A|nr:hypothetical protein [Fundidesulfovibrio agrisoli]
MSFNPGPDRAHDDPTCAHVREEAQKIVSSVLIPHIRTIAQMSVHSTDMMRSSRASGNESAAAMYGLESEYFFMILRDLVGVMAKYAPESGYGEIHDILCGSLVVQQ